MVNQDYEEFFNAQKDHKSQYIGGGKWTKKDGSVNDPVANGKTTDISVGAEGRNENLKGE